MVIRKMAQDLLYNYRRIPEILIAEKFMKIKKLKKLKKIKKI